MERDGETRFEVGGGTRVPGEAGVRRGRNPLGRVAVTAFVLALVAGLYLPPGRTHVGLAATAPRSPTVSVSAIAATDLEAVFDTLGEARTRQVAGRQVHAFSWLVGAA